MIDFAAPLDLDAALEYGLEDDSHLEPREVGAETVVPPEAEGQVLVRGASDVEAKGVFED